MATLATPTTDLRAIQDRYATRLKARLARPQLEVRDARDGILDCFVATYYGGLTQGLRDVLGVSANADEVARIATGLFRKKLREHGSSFEAPSNEALAAVKDEVDRELHIVDLPAELRGVHDQVCSLLLAKADGMLPHAGDRSVTEPAPRTPEPARPASRASAVAGNLRGALAGWLRELADAAERGAPHDDLHRGLERAHRLSATLAEFES